MPRLYDPESDLCDQVNLLGDFAGGSYNCALGILLALFERTGSGSGQVVDAAMLDGAAYLTSFIHAMRSAGQWRDEAGTNTIDTGAPFYDTCVHVLAHSCVECGWVTGYIWLDHYSWSYSCVVRVAVHEWRGYASIVQMHCPFPRCAVGARALQ